MTRGKKSKGDVVVDNHKCLFVSHVSAAMAGDRVRVKNSDPVLHNTHGFLGKPTVFNLALPNKEQMIDITRRLTKPGAVRVLCDAHPHMSGWLMVHDSPYVAVTDDHGAFRIDGVPPGTWKVTMWHEGFRPRGYRQGRPPALRRAARGDERGHGRAPRDGDRRVRAEIMQVRKGEAHVQAHLRAGRQLGLLQSGHRPRRGARPAPSRPG